jgi:hypothetical protein
VQLADVFDPCGFTLFLDDRGLILEAHPVAADRSSSSTRSESESLDGRR